MNFTTYHIKPVLLWVCVIFVRIPVLLPLYILVLIGEWAEKAGDYLGELIPGLERNCKQ